MQQRTYSSRGELYQHITSCLAHLVVYESGEVISIGSGFTCAPDGAILTAAHVVAGGFPVKQGEVDQANRTILALFSGRAQAVYKPAICPIQVQLNAPNIKPSQLDIAMLVPAERPDREVPHLTTSIDSPRLGDEMYFAGYSDEVELSYAFDRGGRYEGMDVFRRQIVTGIKERIAGPIIKRATIGNIREMQWTNGDKLALKQSIFYLDNSIHSGASGGPIVCTDGTVRGLISKRTMTKAGEAVVPAGSTLGVGLEPLRAVAVMQDSCRVTSVF